VARSLTAIPHVLICPLRFFFLNRRHQRGCRLIERRAAHPGRPPFCPPLHVQSTLPTAAPLRQPKICLHIACLLNREGLSMRSQSSSPATGNRLVWDCGGLARNRQAMHRKFSPSEHPGSVNALGRATLDQAAEARSPSCPLGSPTPQSAGEIYLPRSDKLGRPPSRTAFIVHPEYRPDPRRLGACSSCAALTTSNQNRPPCASAAPMAPFNSFGFSTLRPRTPLLPPSAQSWFLEDQQPVSRNPFSPSSPFRQSRGFHF